MIVREHWDRVYDDSDTEELGWYEAYPEVSLELIKETGVGPSGCILDIGSGASTLIGELLRHGYREIVAADISQKAFDQARSRLSGEESALVRWLVDDVTNPTVLREVRDVQIWHDRALLHFLLDEKDRAAYRGLIDRILAPNGWVIIGAFAKSGARMCSGLPVRNYDVEMLRSFMGEEFELINQRDHQYVMPSGDTRPYIYTLFRARQ